MPVRREPYRDPTLAESIKHDVAGVLLLSRRLRFYSEDSLNETLTRLNFELHGVRKANQLSQISVFLTIFIPLSLISTFFPTPNLTAESSPYSICWGWLVFTVDLISIVLLTNLPPLTPVRNFVMFLLLFWSLLYPILILVLLSYPNNLAAGVVFLSGLPMIFLVVSPSVTLRKLREQTHTLRVLALSICKRRSGFDNVPQSGGLCVFNYCVSTRPAFKNVTDWIRDVERLSDHDAVPAITTELCFGAFASLWINSEAGEGGQGKSELNLGCKHNRTTPPNAMNKS